MFLESARTHRLYAAYALALTCGMRRGELTGLRWSHIDAAEGIINVKTQIAAADREPRGVVERDPKGTSERRIPVGPAIIALLQAHRDRWEQERADAGPRWVQEDTEFVFCSNRGEEYNPGHFTRTFTRLAADAGLPRICLHDARHTSATIGIAAGVDVKSMQTRMGHASPTTTMGIYVHPVNTAERQAANTMEDRIFRKPSTSEPEAPAIAA